MNEMHDIHDTRDRSTKKVSNNKKDDSLLMFIRNLRPKSFPMEINMKVKRESTAISTIKAFVTLRKENIFMIKGTRRVTS